ncbi:MAG: bifunctional phosphoribosylaminoimidazolecarboxamide formyltransferase/IMP cyclohydrolase [Dehalococcoidia bacterium]|jgi:phosphoribosylaminoimidazolecarboxamide formyltransferase/IMP cyclohydrolase|nr:bifunctional phosphoribosylaminoimidazolecarboxamide formyltransferase/IMP cyclohydrolase [Dehalococcoidia bacterium]
MIALISVSDKRGVKELALGLAELGFDIYSTGGTQRYLLETGLPVHSISSLTGFPEILDGRVKTLHPFVHAGILARRERPEHMEELQRSQIPTIDLVCVNLYPFAETVARPHRLEEALEQIDIGGPTLLRAAAKNFPSVIVLSDPDDYEPVLEMLREGEVPMAVRRRLAAKAFQHVAAYDSIIAQYLREEEELFPLQLTVALEKVQDLRYGENPHQRAALYRLLTPGPGTGMATARQLHGRELSYNNIMDADAAWQAVCDFQEPTVVIVKHANPCGLASRPHLAEAFQLAFQGDPISAFGGIVAVNRPVDLALAQAIREARHPTSGQRLFLEVIIAPEYEAEALLLLKKSPNLRILQVSSPPADHLTYRHVSGGLLVQEPDRYPDHQLEMKVVTKRAPSPQEMEDLLFAWKACKHVKSNAIVVAKDKALLGMGAGQPNRVQSVRLATEGAGPRAQGAVLASDAFFPFPDSVEEAARAGITAIVQPGGSVRDEEVIRAADHHGLAMVFTGVRHFRH